MITRPLLVRLAARPGMDAEVETFLESALPLVRDEAGTIAWFAIRFGRSEYGIFDVFADEAGREAHLSGAAARTRRHVVSSVENMIAPARLLSLVAILSLAGSSLAVAKGPPPPRPPHAGSAQKHLLLQQHRSTRQHLLLRTHNSAAQHDLLTQASTKRQRSSRSRGTSSQQHLLSARQSGRHSGLLRQQTRKSSQQLLLQQAARPDPETSDAHRRGAITTIEPAERRHSGE